MNLDSNLVIRIETNGIVVYFFIAFDVCDCDLSGSKLPFELVGKIVWICGIRRTVNLM